MGEVYRARDAKLGRDVALKILPAPLATDPERLARFEREAHVLASLNHPHIGAIYGFEETQTVRALVLELVNGPTLAERIAQGPIPSDEALRIAGQIAGALERAHEQGIVHRDLKPANIKIAPGGDVKVLDFGLAKMLEGPAPGLSQSPTELRSLPGVILGTAGYMAPEQAKGHEASQTADVWALGCVLYEMLTRRPAFTGDSVSEILSEVLKSEPDWGRLPPETPESVRRVLRRCLRKDPSRRYHDIADVRLELEDAQHDPQPAEPRAAAPITLPARNRERIAWAAVALMTAIAVVAGGLVLTRSRAPSSLPEMRLDIATPQTNSQTSFAISPDGDKVVFAATSDGRIKLWIRSLDGASEKAFAGTDSAASPFWSPDGRSVGFFADGKLKRVDVADGTVKELVSVAVDRGGAWAGDGTILFTRNYTSPVFRVPASGGMPVAVTQLKPEQGGHRAPSFLPDGRHFLYYSTGSSEARGVYLTQLDDGPPARRLFDADAGAVYVPPGYLLFARQETLFAQGFDPGHLELMGNPFPLVQRVITDGGLAAVSASTTGPIVWRTGVGGESRRQFAWFDRSGNELRRVGEVFLNGRAPSLSPDGQRVAFFREGTDGNIDIWLLETERGVFSRFTFDAANDVMPAWSPDSKRLLFSSNRNGGIHNLYLKSIGAAPGSEQLFLHNNQIKQSTDWSPDGRFVVFRSQDPKLGFDLWALPMEGSSHEPFVVAQTGFDERDAQFSPDGKWIAFQSNESGRVEIYLQPFPGPGARVLVSTSGGAQVRWSRNGRELFYIALDDRLMSVPVQFSTDGQASVGTATGLFMTRVGGALQSNFPQQYMVSADGQRFLMNVIPDEVPTPLTVLLNWKGGQ
jgi:eukaryotic-like serine/threonine-protein kinase